MKAQTAGESTTISLGLLGKEQQTHRRWFEIEELMRKQIDQKFKLIKLTKDVYVDGHEKQVLNVKLSVRVGRGRDDAHKEDSEREMQLIL